MILTKTDKFHKAVLILKDNVEYTVTGEISNEDDFQNNIAWNTGVDANGIATTTKTNPHSELTWTAVKAEMDKL